MDTSRNKPVNSHDIAMEHGSVWILPSNGNSRRDNQQAWWLVAAPSGRVFAIDPNEAISLAAPGGYHAFVTFDDAAAWCKKYYGVEGWKRDKFGGYHPSETDHDRPCGCPIERREGRWSSSSACDRLSVDGGECKFHRSLRARSEAKDAARREEDERSNAGRRIADDAIEALSGEKITAHAHYRNGGYTGEVVVHAEDVIALLRELQHLREASSR